MLESALFTFSQLWCKQHKQFMTCFAKLWNADLCDSFICQTDNLIIINAGSTTGQFGQWDFSTIYFRFLESTFVCQAEFSRAQAVSRSRYKYLPAPKCKTHSRGEITTIAAEDEYYQQNVVSCNNIFL